MTDRSHATKRKRTHTTTTAPVQQEEVEITCRSCGGSCVYEEDGRERSCRTCGGTGLETVMRDKQ